MFIVFVFNGEMEWCVFIFVFGCESMGICDVYEFINEIYLFFDCDVEVIYFLVVGDSKDVVNVFLSIIY